MLQVSHFISASAGYEGTVSDSHVHTRTQNLLNQQRTKICSAQVHAHAHALRWYRQGGQWRLKCRGKVWTRCDYCSALFMHHSGKSGRHTKVESLFRSKTSPLHAQICHVNLVRKNQYVALNRNRKLGYMHIIILHTPNASHSLSGKHQSPCTRKKDVNADLLSA